MELYALTIDSVHTVRILQIQNADATSFSPSALPGVFSPLRENMPENSTFTPWQTASRQMPRQTAWTEKNWGRDRKILGFRETPDHNIEKRQLKNKIAPFLFYG